MSTNEHRPNVPTRVYASDATYDAGLEFPPGTPAPWAGQDTKDDPGDTIAAAGIIPGQGFPAERMNHELNRLGQRGRYQDMIEIANWRGPVNLEDGIINEAVIQEICWHHGGDPAADAGGCYYAAVTDTNGGLYKSSSGYGWSKDSIPGAETEIRSVASNGDETMCFVGSISGPADDQVWCYASGAYTAGSPLALAGGITAAYKIVYEPSRDLWVIAGTDGSDLKIALSGNPESDSWSYPTVPATTATIFSHVAASSVGCVVAGGSVGTGELVYSTDGTFTTWTRTTVTTTAGTLCGVCWSEACGVFMAVSTAGHVFTSPDCVTWTARGAAGFPASVTVLPNTLFAYGSIFVLSAARASTNGAFYVSTDMGETWSLVGRVNDSTGGRARTAPTVAGLMPFAHQPYVALVGGSGDDDPAIFYGLRIP